MVASYVGVVDYGMGNLRSVQNAIEHIGCKPVIVTKPSALLAVDKIILPGVGAFGLAISCLHQTGLSEALNARKEAGVQILGICLGMQLMCRDSAEGGEYTGLNWFAAQVTRFAPITGLSVPHMGWNSVDFVREDPILAGLTSGDDAYFLHSYYVDCDDPTDVLATTGYGLTFSSVIQRGNLRGIQFHPEKSQGFGLAMIRNFLEMPC